LRPSWPRQQGYVWRRVETYNLLGGELRTMGSVVKKRRKKMSKHKHKKLLKRTRIQRRKRK